MFDPIIASENIKDEFTSYISTNFHLADKAYDEQFKAELNKAGIVAKGPYLDISDAFESGESIEKLIERGIASPLFRDLEPNIEESQKEIKIERPLYSHQMKALEKIHDGKNIVVTTGTGSGKTECFMIPIINHLLTEKENGSLGEGVRAILIYPMNALANDQMKRLRLILKGYPDITFGVYNSSTEQTDEQGIKKYGEIYKDEDGRAIKPLKNELISREAMRNHPPHILVTNYAMLEYMMLRPNDDLVFSGAKLRFLVLDEAHIYRGATGIETSLLLRRLKGRISDAGNVLHILTSATLGGKEADADIVEFAHTLCDATFEADDIIRSTPIVPEFPDESIDYSMELFAELANPQEPLNAILDKYNVRYDSSLKDSEILYNLCLESTAYRTLRECVRKPLTVSEITVLMKSRMNVTQEDVVNLISVAAQADKNKTALIKARYHMFIRALEGAFITIGKEKKLFLTRQTVYEKGNDSYKVFEAAVCDDCGRLGIAGKEVNGKLEFSSNIRDDEMEVYLLRNQDEEIDSDEEDEEENQDEQGIDKNDYLICSVCGEIHHESQAFDFSCSHGESKRVKIRKAERKGTRNEPKCPSCNYGSMKLFYIGYDAATAVLGTELFEQLPETETKLESKTQVSNNIFSMATTPSVDVIKKTRQFLVFSDSRSEAAYYACYMSSFYKEFLRRRGIWHIIEQNKDSISRNPWDIKTLVDELTAYFDANRTFADPEDTPDKVLTPTSRHQAWIAVLNEMVNARRSTSLVSLGIVDFEFKGNTDQIMQGVAGQYHENIDDVKALFNLLVMDLVYNGAIESADFSPTDEEREYIYYTSVPRRFIKCKVNESDRKKNYLMGWLPRMKENGTRYKNGRIKRLMNILSIDEDAANSLLDMYWDGVLKNCLKLDANNEYCILTDQFVIKAGTESRPIYVCSKCGKTTMVNCKGKCISLKCDGTLNEVAHDSLTKDNHFAKLYATPLMKPLHIKEHTAQLGREEQQKYQELFINKDINALSSSTTFEMGVDVGDLETVYLRNMPPTPANYVQRAGRAGRSLHSAAYALTYSKLSSHDFTYYDKPEKMISGKIGVPLFSIENEKVVLRHIFAIALSSFLAAHEEVYNGNNADVLLNGNGYELLVEYLTDKPVELKNLLIKSIPAEMHEVMGITDYSWVDKLVGEDGALKNAVDDFRETVNWYEKEIKRLKRQSGNEIEIGKYKSQLLEFRRGAEDHRGRNELIEFLVRNNVLPKYGFPVDTVELYQSINPNKDTKKLQMVRDLQLAISEYAPDSQVVADGKLYTSRYIRKLPQATGQDWEEVFIAECGNPSCRTWNLKTTEPSQEGEICVSCGNIIEKAKWKKAIEPRKGFIAENNPTDVPLRKPERSYRSDDYYIGDLHKKFIGKYTYKIADENLIQMETSANDSLMVVCNDDFYVCGKCGYAMSSSSGKNEKNFNPYLRTYEKRHISPWGKTCTGKLHKRNLCHSFRTDVVKIIFGTPGAKSQPTMLSVMYALLEAASRTLDIERTDIKGCLYKVRYNKSLVYAVILYDAVAGGAGHVRRLVTEDCQVFQKVIKEAIRITKGCNCKPSCYNCLRNYYNQSVHDLLNREAAYTFLEQFEGKAEYIENDIFERSTTVDNNEEYQENSITFSNEYAIASQYRDWSEIASFITVNYDEVFADFDNYGIPLPTCAYATCSIRGTQNETSTFMVWKNEKIMLFEDEADLINVNGWTSMHVNEVRTSDFANLFTRR